MWRETSRHRHRRQAPQQAGFGSQTERRFFSLGKPRTKGSRFALARLIVKYGYYVTGERGMPIQQYDSTVGAGRPIPQQTLIGRGLPGPYGGNVYGGKARRLLISMYQRMPPLPSKKNPRLTAPVRRWKPEACPSLREDKIHTKHAIITSCRVQVVVDQ